MGFSLGRVLFSEGWLDFQEENLAAGVSVRFVLGGMLGVSFGEGLVFGGMD